MSVKLLYSMDSFQKDVIILANKIKSSEFHPIGIYGVPQGGIPLAMALSHYMDIPLVTHCNDDRVLVVDDLIDSGVTRNRYPNNHFACLHIKTNVVIEDNNSFIFYVHDDIDAWIVYWWEGSEEKSIDDSVLRQIEYIGENSNREGLIETPSRVIKSWGRLYGGYNQKPEDVMKVFAEGACDEMVILKDIEMFSTCEHHLLPFFGKAHIAYLPDKKVMGISKLARLLEVFSRRMQIQERIGDQVTTALMEYLHPLGAACIIEAQHFCMLSRGVEKQNSIMITSSLKGVFKEKPAARAELMGLIR